MKYPADRAETRYCSRCEQWRPFSDFYCVPEPRVKRGYAYMRQCKDCQLESKGHDRLVRIDRLRPSVSAMVEQVGFQATAERIGVARATISYWLGHSTPHHGKPAKRVQQSQVVKVLRARIALNKEIQSGKVFELSEHQRKQARSLAGRCVGCGTDRDNYTDGCGSCWDRRRSRERRAS